MGAALTDPVIASAMPHATRVHFIFFIAQSSQKMGFDCRRDTKDRMDSVTRIEPNVKNTRAGRQSLVFLNKLFVYLNRPIKPGWSGRDVGGCLPEDF